MDPNACLREIARLLDASRGTSEDARVAGEELDETCDYLFDWIARGGFEPTNKADQAVAWSYYECRAIAIRRGERVSA